MKLNKIKVIKGTKKMSPLKIRKVLVAFFWIILVSMILLGFINISYNKKNESNSGTSKPENQATNSFDVGITTFSTKFVKTYFTFSSDDASRQERIVQLKNYMTDELVNSSSSNIAEMKGVSSVVNNIDIWNVEQIKSSEDNNFKVNFTVYQELTTSEGSKSNVDDTYFISVHKDDKGNYIVIQSPTVTTKPSKSSYKVKNELQADINLTNEERNKINDFLNTFFKIYPKASSKELVYYVKDNIEPLNKNLDLVSLNNIVITKVENGYSVSLDVVYKNNQTKFQSLNHFDIGLITQNGELVINKF
ncbi:conjugal transfer protein [Clostridium paridis]|uniref:Conjugal transfer protein n=1 Tax=Clostridium paridis TaxID=2803863 RepID=A0A937FIL9_9CLOT|nr:conjugal transfer protein [Clostridium paridis]MBL4932281.1 conjugal transfer protein [Clostridium paridis]